MEPLGVLVESKNLWVILRPASCCVSSPLRPKGGPYNHLQFCGNPGNFNALNPKNNSES